jgi:hypothetical protein
MAFGETARQCAVEHHDLERGAASLEALYERLRPRPARVA